MLLIPRPPPPWFDQISTKLFGNFVGISGPQYSAAAANARVLCLPVGLIRIVLDDRYRPKRFGSDCCCYCGGGRCKVSQLSLLKEGFDGRCRWSLFRCHCAFVIIELRLLLLLLHGCVWLVDWPLCCYRYWVNIHHTSSFGGNLTSFVPENSTRGRKEKKEQQKITRSR